MITKNKSNFGSIEDFNKMIANMSSDYNSLLQMYKALNANINSTIIVFSTLIDILISKNFISEDELKKASKDAFEKIENENKKRNLNNKDEHNNIMEQLMNSENFGNS